MLRKIAAAVGPLYRALIAKWGFDILYDWIAARVVVDTRMIRAGQSDDVKVKQTRERKPNLPIQPDLTAGFTYVRLICNPLLALNEPYFSEWTERIGSWLGAGTTVYLIIHCPEDIQAPKYARALYARIAPDAGLPPLPDPSDTPHQGTLL